MHHHTTFSFINILYGISIDHARSACSFYSFCTRPNVNLLLVNVSGVLHANHSYHEQNFEIKASIEYLSALSAFIKKQFTYNYVVAPHELCLQKVN